MRCIDEIIWFHKAYINEDDWESRRCSIYLARIYLQNPKRDLKRKITKEEKAKIPLLEKAEKELDLEFSRAEKLFGKYYTDLWW